jgi:hypothetical protein
MQPAHALRLFPAQGRRSHGADGGPFRALLSDASWKQLPCEVQRRFARNLARGETAAFLGEVAFTRLTKLGWLWAQVARLIGAPLPLKVLARTPAAVLVTADTTSHTQIWTRIYHEAGLLPQVIRSMKSFSGPTGLEEWVGAGVGMTLQISVEQRAIVFRSVDYVWRYGRWRLRIPDWLTPGRIEVTHREEREGQFSFGLRVVNPLFGEIIHQLAFFRDVL